MFGELIVVLFSKVWNDLELKQKWELFKKGILSYKGDGIFQ